MKTLLTILAISSMPFGCAPSPVPTVNDSFITLDCIVEAYEPEALVFYAANGLPHDARSRVSKVRVIAPAALAGRIYSIDLLTTEYKKDVGFEDLCRPGAVVRLTLPASLTMNSEKQMIPVYELKKAPIQSSKATRRSSASTRI